MIEKLPDIGVHPNWGLTEAPEMRVKKVSFGDGYEQRSEDGLNSVKRKWSPNWTLLDEGQKDQIYNFLIAKKGVYAFLWEMPSGAEVRVVCSSVTWAYAEFDDYSVTANFEEDFGL